MIRIQMPKELKRSQKTWAEDAQKVENSFKPCKDKKDYEAIFMKYISIGDDGEEHWHDLHQYPGFQVVKILLPSAQEYC